jgi:hypothetical protein
MALAAIIGPSTTPSTCTKALPLVPTLKPDRCVALAAVAQRGTLNVKALFNRSQTKTTTSTYDFTDNIEIAVAVVQKSIKVFHYFSDQLKLETHVFLAAMNDQTVVDVYSTIPLPMQVQYPQLMVHSIAVTPQRDLQLLRHFVSETL